MGPIQPLRQQTRKQAAVRPEGLQASYLLQASNVLRRGLPRSATGSLSAALCVIYTSGNFSKPCMPIALVQRGRTKAVGGTRYGGHAGLGRGRHPSSQGGSSSALQARTPVVD